MLFSSQPFWSNTVQPPAFHTNQFRCHNATCNNRYDCSLFSFCHTCCNPAKVQQVSYSGIHLEILVFTFSIFTLQSVSSWKQTFKVNKNMLVRLKSYYIKFLKVGLTHPANAVWSWFTVSCICRWTWTGFRCTQSPRWALTLKLSMA